VAAPGDLAASAAYLALRRSGAYGLVADAQNLIAIFGVLRAAVYAIEAQQVIRRRGFTGLFRRGFVKIPYKRGTRGSMGLPGHLPTELSLWREKLPGNDH
jgi:hypothetical protein